MPQITDNLLTISGDPADLAAFVARAATGRGCMDFQAFVPAYCNEWEYDIAGLGDDDDASGDELPTAKEAWGTDWNATHESMVGDAGGGLIHYYFETSWNPPLVWLAAVAREHPELALELVYIEPEAGFAGQLAYVQGTLDRELYGEDADVLATYGDRRFDLLRAAIEDPGSVVRMAKPAPTSSQLSWDEILDPSVTDAMYAAAKAARLAAPAPDGEAQYLRLARAYEAHGAGGLADLASWAAGREEQAVARLMDFAGECEASGMPSAACWWLMFAGREAEARALMVRTMLGSMQPSFTP
jgi:hypothetical protein